MKELVIVLFLVLFVSSITACSFENTRQSVGINSKPFSEKAEESVKLNWKITWGKIRPKEDSDD